jgi:hypothetical protein
MSGGDELPAARTSRIWATVSLGSFQIVFNDSERTGPDQIPSSILPPSTEGH